jgi:anaerobic selenocysteine-containing dehydrogenase/Fe-S-cluster-containing dehydrogenase component
MAELDRREFLKIVGVGAGAAAATGCSDPVSKLIPYVVQPEEITPGIAVTYASTCVECETGCGLHVRTREGRPIKLEGNPDHPINQGKLCARGQAGTQRTYHPDRFRGPAKRGADGSLETISWDEAHSLLAQKLQAAGAKARVLGGPVGPTLTGLIDSFLAAAGSGGGHTVYEPFSHEVLRQASNAVFGVDSQPRFDLSQADYVIDFGADALETGTSPVEHARQLAAARDIQSHPGGGARFVYVGPRLSMTAGNSDEWLPAKPGSEGILALALAKIVVDAKGSALGGEVGAVKSVLAGFDVETASRSTGIPADSIRRIGQELAASNAPAALPPGVSLTSRRATATAAAVLILNAVAGAAGSTLSVPPAADATHAPASFREVLQLIDAMKSGDVSVLMVHDSNPLYSLPGDAGFAEALEKVDFVVSFASMPDETSAKADLILPDHTPLESWGDAAPRPGIRSLIQPTIRPLYDTQALGDSLLGTARAMGDGVAGNLPSGSFRGVLEAAWSGTDFREALARGGEFSQEPVAPLSLSSGVSRLQFAEPKLEGDGAYVLVPFPTALLGDGHSASLSWLQETPDPTTKITWQSWLEMSHTTAAAIGVDWGDVVSVETTFGTVEVPVLPRGGIRDDVIALGIGQGHTVGRFASLEGDGMPGEARGVNANDLLPALTDETGGRAWLTARAKVSSTGRFQRVAATQFEDNKRGRQLGDAISLLALAEAKGQADGHGGGHGSSESHEIRRPYDPADDATDDSEYRWAMTADLDRCTGCSACVVACAIENNIPTVGESAVVRSREMAWLRIERYIGPGDAEMKTGRNRPRDHEKLGEVDVRHSPMMCQQCGAAPCEPVCPVLATYHTAEGLNAMVYNRCIGTRYCSNNCPYKVRRYNWFDYQIENWPEPMRLGLNPDVTVRGQGVMEKCTFCVQRIQGARQLAKDEGRPIADAEILPACVQTCPTSALGFGNAKDSQSAVAKRVDDNEARSYHALHVLNTRPGVTYLKKVIRDAEEKQG